MSKFAEVSYTADGATTLYVVPFGYVETSHVSVYLDDVLTTAYSWSDATHIELNTAPTNGVVIKIKRSTSPNTRLTEYSDGSKLVEDDLNDDSDQAFYLIQETRDLIVEANEDSTALSGRIDDNDTDIATNASNISTNASNISSIDSRLTTAETDIDSNSANIASNDTDIATNASNISTNASNISTNASNIASNDTDIAALDARLTTAESDIDDNTADIVSGDSATLAAAKAYVDALHGDSLAEYAEGTVYALDDVVFYTDNIIYKCTTAHTAGATINLSFWEEISRRLTDAEVKVAYENNANTNAFTDAEKVKLGNIEIAATADQTGAEIKALYEAEADTNAFTDAEQTKLSGIETGATADMTGAEIKTAYEGESDTNAFTDAEKAKLAGIEAGATSGGGIDAWADATAYSVDDIVHYTDNKIYKCTIAHTSSGTLNTSNFQELSEGSSLSASDVKTLYESNSNTNAFTDADNAKLVSIEDNATGDQTASEIKIAYESNADTNAYTDAEQAKVANLSYTNAEPTPVTIGGVAAGTTFSAVELKDIIEDLLYPYQTPYFNYFRVNGSSSVDLKLGETFSGTGLVFTWDIANDSNVQTNSIELNGTTGLANDGTETQNLSDQTNNTVTSSTYNIEATDSNSNTFSDSITLRWRHQRFWGVSASTSLDDAGVLALNNELASNHTKSVTYDGTGGRYFYFAIPQDFGQLTDTTINSLSWNDWVLVSRNVVNENGVSIPYYIYRSNNLINGTITVDWS